MDERNASNTQLAYSPGMRLPVQIQAIETQMMALKIAPFKNRTLSQSVQLDPFATYHQQPQAEDQGQLVESSKEKFTFQKAMSMGLIKARQESQKFKPQKHAKWKLLKVLVGHTGWVRSITVDPANQFFVTGSHDRTIKFWDLASCKLKLSLTGHINAIRGLVVSDRHPYLFSCAEDKTVKCWDLEQNKVVRNYHGHLSGVYSLALHPSIDLLITGGRDAAVRCWDIRLRSQVYCFQGHSHTVGSLLAQQHQPQVISGSYDATIRLWDLVAGKCAAVLTNHKKAIRCMVLHHKEYTFATGAADAIKVWRCPQGQFLRDIDGHNSIINAMALSSENVLVSGCNEGTLKLSDWRSGEQFQELQSRGQPGSMVCQSGILCCSFDRSGLRLLTGQCDKTIKIWGQE